MMTTPGIRSRRVTLAPHGVPLFGGGSRHGHTGHTCKGGKDEGADVKNAVFRQTTPAPREE